MAMEITTEEKTIAQTPCDWHPAMPLGCRRLFLGHDTKNIDFKFVDMSTKRTDPTFRMMSGGSMSPEKPAITNEALSLTRRIVALEGREEALQAELLKIRGELATVQREFEALMLQSTYAPRPPKTSPAKGGNNPALKATKAEKKGKAEKGLGNTGWIHEVLTYMKRHPGQEFSPDSLTKALGDPDHYGLTSTCLGRLYKGGRISRVGRGRFVFLEPKE